MSYEDRKNRTNEDSLWGKEKGVVTLLTIFSVSPYFKEILNKEPELAPAVAAVNALTQVIELSKGLLFLSKLK
jgi:ectoine hydroxylase-related dioxygenase (phytanoyl-CoA dioxygenase family)